MPTLLPFEPAVVRILRIEHDVPDARAGALRALLSSDERARAESLRVPADRRRFVVVRGTLRVLLGRALGLRPERVVFRYEPGGRPTALAGNGEPAPLAFNVSHTDNFSLVALAAPCRLGLDVERVRALPDADAIAARFFRPRERAELQALPEPERTSAFFRAWCRKEAVLKALGTGIAEGLELTEVSLRSGEEPVVRACSDPAARFTLRDVPVEEGWAAALAVEGDRRPPE